MEAKERFIQLLRSTGRQGVEDLLAWLETTDWFTAPASTKYHCAYPGGLVDHSLAVYDELVRLNNTYAPIMGAIPEQSVIIMALLHDLCKVNCYKEETRNRKNAFGAWEQYTAYTKDEKLAYGGHGSKSVFIASRFISLFDNEAIAINCHMATWENGKQGEIGDAFRQTPQAWLLHVADEAATFVQNK